MLCLQEIKWKGQRTRDLGKDCKMYYTGSEQKKNGVGIVLYVVTSRRR